MLNVPFAEWKKILLIWRPGNMEKYDYRKAMVNDIKEYMKDNPD
jgi:hypothetical protein